LILYFVASICLISRIKKIVKSLKKKLSSQHILSQNIG